MDKKFKLSLLILAILLILPSIYAEVVCDTSYISLTYRQRESITKSINCNNVGNQTISITKSGDFFSVNSDSIIPGYKNITINFDSNAIVGLHVGQITFGGTNPIQLFFYTEAPIIQNTGCSPDVFPTSLQNLKVQQGEKKIRFIQISIPECMRSSVNLKGISLSSDQKPIEIGELAIGLISPGRDIQIPISIDATGIAVGQYNDILSILAYDSNGTKIIFPTVSIGVLVTAGINPISNFSFSMLPTCSLSSLILNTNNTYTFTCQINNPNIQVRPIVDTKYINGISVATTSNQYVYSFSAIKTGITNFCADYISTNSPIGGGFCSELKITTSGSSVGSGINLKAEFYQNGIKKDISSIGHGNTIILVLDNSTGNLVNPESILVNGLAINNNTISLENGKSYEVRIVAGGYNNLILSNFTVTEIPLSFTIIPEKAIYKINDLVYLNSSVENVTFLFDNVKIVSPYSFRSSGNHTITAVKEGYISSNKSVEVEEQPRLISCSPMQNEWKKGSKIICSLSKNVSWSAILTPKGKSVITLASGNSDKVEFTISDYGNLVVSADNYNVYNQNFERNGWFSYILDNWLWFGGGTIALIVIFVIYRRNVAKSKFESMSPYS